MILNYLKKFIFFVFVWSFLITTNSFSVTNESKKIYGAFSKRVDLNLECKGYKGTNSIRKIGYKSIKSKDGSKEILVKLRKHKDGEYGWPQSVVTDFGPIDFEGERYDNMQMSFSHHHKKVNNNYYVFRSAILTKGDNYVWSESWIKTDKKIIKKLESYIKPLDDIIKFNKNVDDYISKITDYTFVASEYVMANVRDNLDTVYLYRCKRY